MKIFDYLIGLMEDSRETLEDAGIAKITVNVNEVIDENVTSIFVYPKGDDYDTETVCEDITNETGIETKIKDISDYDPADEILIYED